MQMNTFFITDNGNLIEVIERVMQIKFFTPWGAATQPRTNYEYQDRGEASEEDRRRIPRELGGYA
ncbi:hypothetical protein HZ99_21610 [Pseudomonas fluorescens]|uniref:Uncharacterized protein n=2 Tax=Pseudomonas TaxID=286 RepID=A0ABS1H1E3_9PSED|nr:MULTISPECIES: hypothetical protein [Pseudomonas]AIG04653.1 hypothetical protein HZ99_21610 [Pseudomonas fluorescens]ONH38598.1 hypothetical protein BLL38_23740 [Pseudomonas gessardii]PHN52895.1 hypothetical protein AO268_26480 [Pseudomonas sp. ICMP 8385]MBK3463056.1 hypothetical protein [Pseudomonas haemolytica]MQU21963.1 hypothetical protein [Pseudomonas helleri]